MSTRGFELDDGRITFEESTGKMDPVCGGLVDPNKSTTATAEYAGVAYFFCSNECKNEFLQAPNAFAVTRP